MRAIIFESTTGNAVDELEFTSCETDTGILASDKITIDIPGYTPKAATMDLRKLLTPLKYGVAVQTPDGRVPAAGIITAPPEASDDADGNHSYSITCYGPEKIIAGWSVRKYPGWPLVGVDRKPTGLYDVNITGVQYGTMMKMLIQEAMKFSGAELPLFFEPSRAGTRQKSWEAIAGKSVMSAIDDIADLLGGVEYDFVPRIGSNDQVSWEFVTATDAIKEISSAVTATWRLGGVSPDLKNFRRSSDPSSIVTEAVFSGGKEDDEVMLARSQNSGLVDAGFPRKELWDSSHSSVSEQDTLQGWADGSVTVGSGVIEEISFDVKADKAVGLRHGDLCQIQSKGHWDMPDGVYDRRILSVVRKDDSEWVSIQVIGEVSHG